MSSVFCFMMGGIRTGRGREAGLRLAEVASATQAGVSRVGMSEADSKSFDTELRTKCRGF